MTNPNRDTNYKSGSQKAFRWLAFLAALALMVSLVSIQPVGAGTGVPVSDIPAPSVPVHPLQAITLQSYNLTAPQQQAVLQPPVPNQGGTCISGYLIDSYHKQLGAGWTVTITPSGGSAQTQATAGDGTFKFTGLAGGTYTVELTMPETGWRPFTPTSFQVTLSGTGDGCAEVRFKLEALPCIEVVKVDANGSVDGTKVGIPDWGFTLTQGETKVTGRTDGQGIATFQNLNSGKWTITEEEKTGWRPASGYGASMDMEIYPPQTPGTCQTALFVNEQVTDACITVQKADVAGNPVEGWNVSISRNDGTQAPANAVTDSTGQVTFNNLALGSWTVTEETREWWKPVGQTSQTVTLERPGFCTVIKFVNEPLGCVDGLKINKLDQGLPGWKINARNQDTGEQFSTVTDQNGYFKFTNLSLGTWVMSEDMQAGWTPVTAPEFTVQVKEPFKCQTVRFKNTTPYACLDVFKKDQIDGVGLPGWTITLQPAFGGESVTGTTDGTGWVRFNQLTPGSYIVKETLQPGWTATTPEDLTIDLQATGTCAVVNFTNIQTHMIPTEPPYPPNPTPAPTQCVAYYTVRCGDTAWGIANYYGITVNQLAKANHLKNPSVIYVGQKLCIPDP